MLLFEEVEGKEFGIGLEEGGPYFLVNVDESVPQSPRGKYFLVGMHAPQVNWIEIYFVNNCNEEAAIILLALEKARVQEYSRFTGEYNGEGVFSLLSSREFVLPRIGIPQQIFWLQGSDTPAGIQKMRSEAAVWADELTSPYTAYGRLGTGDFPHVEIEKIINDYLNYLSNH